MKKRTSVKGFARMFLKTVGEYYFHRTRTKRRSLIM